jgi:hypothetical protein
MTVLLISVSVLAGAGMAFLLYFRERNSALDAQKRVFLALIRGLIVFLICLLLSSVMINTSERNIEKPIIAFLIDNSKSMTYSKDSTYLTKDFINDVENISNALKEHADVLLYQFDNKLKNGFDAAFDGEQTDIYRAIDELLVRYEGRNIGAMILATDGISNTGNDPYSLMDKIWFPVYSIAVGDTARYADLSVRAVRYNKTVAFGNRFPLEIVISAENYNGKNSQVIISQGDKELFKRTVQFSSADYSETFTVMLDANQKGLLRLGIQIIPVSGEKNQANNYATAVIQVVEKKNKVAILYFAVHPDISAIKSTLEEAGNYIVDDIHVNALKKGEISDYDAVVLYQLPDKRSKTDFFTEIQSFKIPWLMIVGMNTDLRQMNSMNAGYKIQQASGMYQEALASVNSAFSLFQLSSETFSAFSYFPPLTAPFGNYSLAENFRILLYQKIGNIQTQNPMLAFGMNQSGMSAVLFGEGIFKWKLYNYLKFQNHLAFHEIVQKTMNLLVQQADKRRLRVFHKEIYYSTENAEMTAEVYNMSMEMITDATIDIAITHENAAERSFQFIPQISDYKLKLGQLKPGKYLWNAATTIEGEKLTDSGVFYVEELNIEALNTQADHNLLKFMSKQSGGNNYSYKQIQNLPQDILNNGNIVNIEYFNKKSDYLISYRWLLIVLILLLSMEWALRKYWGTY